jgi:hypothetical protein
MATFNIEDRKRFGVSVDEIKRLQQKWHKLIEGIDDNYMRTVLPILYENTMVSAKSNLLVEDVQTGSLEVIPTITLPLIRRVFPGLIANEIVSVQPLTGPVGAIFYLDAVYGTTKSGITAGDKMFYQSPFSPEYSSAATQTAQYVDGVAGRTGFTATLTSKPIVRGGVTIKVKLTDGTNTAEVVAVDDGKGHIAGTASLGAGTASVSGMIDYFTGTIVVTTSHDIATGTYGPSSNQDVEISYKYFVEASTNFGEVSLELKMAPVQAETRKLKASWSVETLNDLQRLWGQDAEQLLVQFIANEIRVEIDRSIVEDLRNLAVASGNTRSWNRTPASGLYPADSAEYIRTLITQFNYVASTIYKLSFRGEANYVVIPSEALALLRTLPEFVAETEDMVQIARVGRVGNKYKVYVNVYQPNNFILVGYQGPDLFDTGYVYAPYVPLMFTPTFFDPETLKYKRGAIERFGRKAVRNYYYGYVTINW